MLVYYRNIFVDMIVLIRPFGATVMILCLKRVICFVLQVVFLRSILVAVHQQWTEEINDKACFHSPLVSVS